MSWLRRPHSAGALIVATVLALFAISLFTGQPLVQLKVSDGGAAAPSTDVKSGDSGKADSSVAPAKKEKPAKYAFATFLSHHPKPGKEKAPIEEDMYYLSTRVLGWQLMYEKGVRSEKGYDFIVITTPEVPKPMIDQMEKEGIVVKPVEHLTAPWMKPGDKRWSDVMTKLRLFQLTEYEKILFIDSDSMVLKNIDGVFEDPAAQPMKTKNNPEEIKQDEAPLPKEYIFGGISDAVNKAHTFPPAPLHYFNAGFFVFKPSKEVFDYYNSVLQIPDRFDSNLPEQNLLNYAHREKGNMPAQRLDQIWNVNFPVMRDVEMGVYTVHDKFWEGQRDWEPIEEPLEKLWWQKRWQMDGYYKALRLL